MTAPLPGRHFVDSLTQGPRFREVGEMTLDMFHRDARVDDRWLGLAAEEFAVLWRLAARPGERLTRQQLRAETWHLSGRPGPDWTGPNFARMRAKLMAAGVAHLICNDGERRIFLVLPTLAGLLQVAAGG